MIVFQVIMPGYCVAGTVGHKILNGVKRLEMENKQNVCTLGTLDDLTMPSDVKKVVWI